MRALSSLGIVLSLVTGCLLLALIAELYYLLWWKKRVAHTDIEQDCTAPARALFHLSWWKKMQTSLSSSALIPREVSENGQAELLSDSKDEQLMKPFGDDDCLETELMRLYGLSGPPRLLFTIVEETKEDLESEDGRSRGRSLSELLLAAETPFMTPLASPSFYTTPQSPCYRTHGFNPLFESSNDEVSRMRSASPPPKFKFLKDAEEKLYRRTLMEEAIRVHKNGGSGGDVAMEQPVHSTVPSPPNGEDGDGSFITIVIAKNREKGHVNHHQHHLSSSQVIPLASSPSNVSSDQCNAL